MTTLVIEPTTVSGAELDHYLERGWYRIGNTMMTCRYYVSEGGCYATIWTRLPLKNYAFRKGLRKLLSRRQRRFRTTVQRLVLDHKREDLYTAYLSVAPGERASTLEEFLGGEQGIGMFDTWEIGIWDGDTLVGMSLFDPGDIAMQSLSGLYHPDYARYGLGFYSMVLEVKYAMELDLEYHYSGYVVPGLPFMDYKWRLGGDMEVLHPDQGTWQHHSELDDIENPADRLKAELATADVALRLAGLRSQWRLNEMFEARHIDPALSACVIQPLVLDLDPERDGGMRTLITWEVERRMFLLLRCVQLMGRLVPADGDESRARTVTYWLVVDELAASTISEHIAAAAKKAMR